MSGEINRVPEGLLSLLDMKARGQNPRTLSGVLQAGVDLTQLYLWGRRARASGSAVVLPTTFGAIDITGPSVIVPQTQLWIVERVTTYTSNPLIGSGQLRWVNAWRFNPNRRYHVLGDCLPYVASNTDAPSLGYTGPFIAGPGDAPAIIVNENAAFTVDPTMLMEILYVPLDL